MLMTPLTGICPRMLTIPGYGIRMTTVTPESLFALKTRKVIANIAPLGMANAYIFLQCLQDALDQAPSRSSKNLVMSTEALRVGIRLGLIKKTGSLNVGCKEFGKLLEPADYIAFQHFFVRHAEMACFSKNPKCESCFLNSLCKYFKP